MCDVRLDDGPLVCVRKDVHTTHRFEASNVPDGHDLSEQLAEDER